MKCKVLGREDKLFSDQQPRWEVVYVLTDMDCALFSWMYLVSVCRPKTQHIPLWRANYVDMVVGSFLIPHLGCSRRLTRVVSSTGNNFLSVIIVKMRGDTTLVSQVLAVLGQRFALTVMFGHPDSVAHPENERGESPTRMSWDHLGLAILKGLTCTRCLAWRQVIAQQSCTLYER